MARHTLRLLEAAERYEAHTKARGLVASTIRGQQDALRLFERVIGDLQLDSITSEHVDRVFTRYHWAPTTRNNRIGQYRAFFNWARGAGYMNPLVNPMLGWRQKTPPQVKRMQIPHDEWSQLFKACRHPQERIVIATGLYLFLRASEQQALTIGDVDLQANLVEIHRRKTQQYDTMPISAELEVELRRWLKYLSENYEPTSQSFLIPSRMHDLTHNENHQWVAGTGSLNLDRPLAHPHRVVQRVLRRAGYEVEVGQGEHTLRRSGARAYFDSLVDQGYDGALRRVQSMLGHKHSYMTEHYLGIDLDRRKRNTDLAGRPMFPVRQDAQIIPIRGVSNGS